MQSGLCIYYSNLGDDDKALEAAAKLPSMWDCSDMAKMNILKGDDLVKLIQNNIYLLTNIMCCCLYRMADINAENDPELTWEQRIEILRKAIAIFDVVFDKGDYNACTCNLSSLHREISAMAIKAGDLVLALDSIEKAAEYAKAMDLLPEKKPYVSLLVNRMEYKTANMAKNFTDTFSEGLLKKMSDSRFDKIRDDPRFKAVEKSLA